MGKAFLYGNGGGGSGGTLVVSAPVGVTVTATNEVIGKTYKRTANAAGIATFKGLATGVWSLSISDGETTSTPVSVQVNADYEITLAFFSAEIVVNYPANSTCTCSDGTTTFTDTNGTDAEKTVTFTVPNKGKWTVTSTANNGSGDSASKTVEITAEGQSVNVELGYNMVAFLDGKYRDIGSMSNMTLEDGELVLTATNYQAAWSFSDIPVDLSEYSTLHWDMKWVNNNGTNWEYRSCWIGLSAKNTPVTNEATATDAIYASQFVAYFKISDKKTYEDVVAIDISTLTGKYYLCAFTNSWVSNGGTGNTILYSREIVAE